MAQRTRESLHANRLFATIINTDKINQPGTHWVCACIEFAGSPKSTCYFYNSLGEKPNQTMIRELKRIGRVKDFYYWDTQQQPDDSYKCGYYCLSFLRRFMEGKRGIDLYTDLGLTDDDFKDNETAIKKDNMLT